MPQQRNGHTTDGVRPARSWRRLGARGAIAKGGLMALGSLALLAGVACGDTIGEAEAPGTTPLTLLPAPAALLPATPTTLIPGPAPLMPAQGSYRTAGAAGN